VGIFRREARSGSAQRNPWLAAGVPTLTLFGGGFLLRVLFGSVAPGWMIWFVYGGLGLLGLVLTVVGLVKARGAGARVARERAGRHEDGTWDPRG
jgi:hypothetical protein